MEKDSSPLDTLRQLKEWLDAGTITPQEFEALKRKLLFPDAAASTVPAAPTVLPTSPALTPTTSAPVEDPLLPPVVHVARTPEPSLAPPPTPPTAEPGLTHPLEAGRPASSPSTEDQTMPPPTARELPEIEEVEEAPYTAPARSPLATVLIVGGIVALLALVAYLMLGSRESERLTSTSLTAADSVAVQPETGPQAEQIDLPPAAAPETIRVAPVVPPAATAPADTAAASTAPATPAPAEETPAAPSPADESAAQARIEGILSAYYSDLQAAPFAATTYFAPRVERFYLLQNTTPAAINDELAKSHFPEFLEAETKVEPGTLSVSPPLNDGSRVVTFQERSKAFRQSRQQHQQTLAQVRVRFDKNFKIVYLRQEKLLENTFSE
ncbi:SHOCT domain-containing protein [Hymenobacter weizhouensis]|uniref:SHOCT domain-containing protein n=1 Tax=Hymenobacter sp. YIM 151500-1 TaxID=2987689 RepID=UPI002227BC4F|nr:hypothetical protein [Hymenobacter sp. YIM 151500-1]UYZ62978.1 hypothetical protein OIS53_18535 [Hymenobacter sp. YIM 151500-1]